MLVMLNGIELKEVIAIVMMQLICLLILKRITLTEETRRQQMELKLSEFLNRKAEHTCKNKQKNHENYACHLMIFI